MITLTHTSRLSLNLIITISYQIIKRFTKTPKPGHVHKIMDSISKSSTATSYSPFPSLKPEDQIKYDPNEVKKQMYEKNTLQEDNSKQEQPVPSSQPQTPAYKEINKTKAVVENTLQTADHHKSHKPINSNDGIKNPLIPKLPPIKSGLVTGYQVSTSQSDSEKMPSYPANQTTADTPPPSSSVSPPTPPPLPQTKQPKDQSEDYYKFKNKTETQSSPQIAFTKQIQEAAKMLNTTVDDNLKPSVVKALMNKSGKVFETVVTPQTKLGDLSKNQLLEETKKREFIKDDNGNTQTTVELIDGSLTVVGTSKNNVKLTPMGQAYYNEYIQKNPRPKYSFNNDVFENSQLQFAIMVPPKISDLGVIENGLHKHLLTVHVSSTDQYFIIQYLTSKSSGKFLCEQQFKTFQNNMKNENPDTIFTKKQNFVELNSAMEIKKENIQKVYGSDEYIKNLPPTSLDKLKDSWNKLKTQPYIQFDYDGVTEEVLLQMIQAYDKNIEEGKPHPITDDQIKQQQQGKEKQQAKQAAAKAAKEKENKLKQEIEYDK